MNNEIITKDNFNEIYKKSNLFSMLDKKLKEVFNDVARSYLEIGFLLLKRKNEELYKPFYESIYDYAKEHFNISITTCKNFINLFERFGELSYYDEYDTCISYCVEVKKEFKSYSYSQLVELLSVDESKLLEYKPSMTVKEMRISKKLEQLEYFLKEQAEENYIKIKEFLYKKFKDYHPSISGEKTDVSGLTIKNFGCLKLIVDASVIKSIFCLTTKNKKFDFYIEIDGFRYDFKSINEIDTTALINNINKSLGYMKKVKEDKKEKDNEIKSYSNRELTFEELIFLSKKLIVGNFEFHSKLYKLFKKFNYSVSFIVEKKGSTFEVNFCFHYNENKYKILFKYYCCYVYGENFKTGKYEIIQMIEFKESFRLMLDLIDFDKMNGFEYFLKKITKSDVHVR